MVTSRRIQSRPSLRDSLPVWTLRSTKIDKTMFGEFDRDWPRFWLHQLIGLLFGAVLGFSSSWYLDLEGKERICVGIHAACIGLLSGQFGDSFWHWFKDKAGWF